MTDSLTAPYSTIKADALAMFKRCLGDDEMFARIETGLGHFFDNAFIKGANRPNPILLERLLSDHNGDCTAVMTELLGHEPGARNGAFFPWGTGGSRISRSSDEPKGAA